MIALAGPNLPHEILYAAGCYAGPLAIDPDRDTRRAAQWLESKFAPWAAVLLEDWVEGRYDGLEAVLFSRADDSSQRLYYYICELQRTGRLGGPEALIFDIPKIPRSISREHVAEQLRALGARLSVTSDQLESAIRTVNIRRAGRSSPPLGRRCLLAGTPPPDRRLHAVIEAAEFVPVGATLADDWSDLGPRVDEDSADPVASLAAQLHERTGGPRSFADPAALLAQRAGDCGAEAAVLWRIEEDEAQSWHLPSERQVLERLNLPHLVMTRRDWRARDGALTEISSFLEGICG